MARQRSHQYRASNPAKPPCTIVLDPAAMPSSEAGLTSTIGHWQSACAMLPTPTTRYPSERLQWSGLSRALRKAAADPRLQEYYRQQNKEWNL